MLKNFNSTRDTSIEPDIKTIKRINLDDVTYKLPGPIYIDLAKMKNTRDYNGYLLKVILEAFFERK